VKLSRVLFAAVVSVVAALSLCANAGAANITVGPSLTGAGWISEPCEFAPFCTFANYELGGTGSYLTSPVTGVVVSFNVLGGSTPGTYRLRTVTPGATPTSWFFKKAAATVAAVPNPGVQAYPTSLPIDAGETVALTASQTASISDLEGVGTSVWWEEEPGELPESGHVLGSPEAEVFGFNAEIQPAPTVTSLGTTSGPTTGGTSVTISGTDVENATGVTFGSTPAASYTVNSESQITAVTPASTSAASVSVTVTTVAGKATSSQQFGYVAPPPPVVAPAPAPKKKKPVAQCVVPKLKGKKLPAAKAALKKADCKAGKVTKLKGATPKTGKVATQSRKPGAKAAAGAKVNLTLKS
jgi:PASTA domain/IPT/TIG domain